MEEKNSDAPSFKEPCVLGIDEAGRGPVLGPMIYTAAYCPKSSLPALKALKADDSKQLAEAQRDDLRTKIDDAPFLRTVSRVLSAHELSIQMLRRVKYNLNLISHEAALSLVRQAIDDGAVIQEVYVDTVGNPDTYAQKFRDAFPTLTKVVVEKKADATYPIVSAASIVAKTTRDRIIREWVFPEEERSANLPSTELDLSHPNQPVSFLEQKGSGYPSDPATKNWMENSCDRIFGFPTFVRFSWATTRTILEKKAVEVDWESDESDSETPAVPAKPKVKTRDITTFFGKKGTPVRPTKQRRTTKPSIPRVFTAMSVQRVNTLI